MFKITKQNLLNSLLLLIVISVVGFLAFQQGKSTGSSSKELEYTNRIDSLNQAIVAKQTIITGNEIEREYLSNEIARIKYQRDSLYAVKRKIKIIHDEEIDIINGADNNGVVELFTGFNRD